MRTIRRLSKFKKDYRRELSGQHGKKLDALFIEIVTFLADDLQLPKRCFDHALIGKFNDCRDCHLRPDLILIYRKIDNVLELV